MNKQEFINELIKELEDKIEYLDGEESDDSAYFRGKRRAYNRILKYTKNLSSQPDEPCHVCAEPNNPDFVFINTHLKANFDELVGLDYCPNCGRKIVQKENGQPKPPAKEDN